MLTLDTGKQKLTAFIGAGKVFDGPVDYATPERLNHVTLQFAAQAAADTTAPAYVDYLKVEVAPAQ